MSDPDKLVPFNSHEKRSVATGMCHLLKQRRLSVYVMEVFSDTRVCTICEERGFTSGGMLDPSGVEQC